MAIHRIRVVDHGAGGHVCKSCKKIIIDATEIESGYCRACKLLERCKTNEQTISSNSELWKKFHKAREEKLLSEANDINQIGHGYNFKSKG
jgi:hypothetical protein